MVQHKRRSSNPVIALGTMTFGGQTTAGDAERMMGIFLDEGHTWFDTAHLYTDGRSERIVGRYLKGRRRARVFLATKAYPNDPRHSSRGGLRPKQLREKLETSLKRLKIDAVDLFYLHAPDNATPLERTLAACRQFIHQGKIRNIGLSNYPAWQVAEAVAISRKNGSPPPIIYQGMYNALTRRVEPECIPACRHFGLDFIAYNPLAGGLLTGKHIGAQNSPPKGRFSGQYYRARYWKEEYFHAVDRLAAAARRAHIPPTDVAIRWLLHHGMADGLIIGASKPEHLRQNLAACRKGPLSPALCNALDQAWQITRPSCQRYFRD